VTLCPNITKKKTDCRLIFGLTGENFVGKLSAMGQPIRPTQLSILRGSVNA